MYNGSRIGDRGSRLIRSGLLVAALSVCAGTVQAQRASALPEPLRQFVTTDSPVIALTNVKIIDGTGAAARDGQTIVIENGRITAVGKSSDVKPPSGAQVMDLAGHTVIPGIVGLHDHLYYTAAGGRAAQLTFSAPRLYLGSGVTTVRTTGSRAPYTEINMKSEIEKGRFIGPRIHITAPYITGGTGNNSMTLLNSPEQARRFVAYWAAEGATWLKSYTDIRRADQLLKELGLGETAVLKLNTLGDPETRRAWRDALYEHFRAHAESLSDDSRDRLERNPLRILDSKAHADWPIVDAAPPIDEFLTGEAANFFAAVTAGLDAAGVRAAVIGMRPSPEPRSTTKSLAPTFPSSSILSTTG